MKDHFVVPLTERWYLFFTNSC